MRQGARDMRKAMPEDDNIQEQKCQDEFSDKAPRRSTRVVHKNVSKRARILIIIHTHMSSNTSASISCASSMWCR